jgi:hypothetical protein
VDVPGRYRLQHELLDAGFPVSDAVADDQQLLAFRRQPLDHRQSALMLLVLCGRAWP